MKQSKKLAGRNKRKMRIRKKIRGTPETPRLSVFRSSRFIYAQIIDDTTGSTLAASSSRESAIASQLKDAGKGTGNRDAATLVGKTIAEKAKKKSIESVVFDRGGFIYTGRVKAIAEAAREAGLKF